MKISKNEKGFTLVEMLIVISIISLLFIMILPQINNGVVRAREAGIRTDFRSFQTASETLMRETLGKGVNLDLLNSYLDNSHEVADSGGVLQTNSEDPWSTPYGVDIGTNKIVFYSHGKEENTANKSYIMATYYNAGSVASCTTGFDTSNIILPFANIPADFECGEDFIAGVGTPVVDPSTDETVALPTEMNGACYVIRTIGQLQSIEEDQYGCFELGNDINASATSSWNGGKGFKPLFTSAEQFFGSLDGKNYKIKNLTINRPTENDVALFRSVMADIKNLNLENVNIVGNASVGSLVGYFEEGNVSNILVSGNITGTQYIGGLTATHYGDITNVHSSVTINGTNYIGGISAYYYGGKVENSSFDGFIYGKNVVGGILGYNEDGEILNVISKGSIKGGRLVGGIVGENRGTISESTSHASVEGTEYYIGGLVGWNYANISKTNATGNISGNTHVGGLVGYSINFSITDSYANGNVSGGSNIGGLIGEIMSSTVKNSYAIGSVSGSSSRGGLVGSSTFSTVTSSYYDKNTTGRSDTGKGIGKLTSEMQQQTTFAGWDFTNVWEINSSVNNGYPYLKNVTP